MTSRSSGVVGLSIGACGELVLSTSITGTDLAKGFRLITDRDAPTGVALVCEVSATLCWESIGSRVAIPGVNEAVFLGGGAESKTRCSAEDWGLTLPKSRSAAYRSLLPRLLMLGLRTSEALLALCIRAIDIVGRVGETNDVCESDAATLVLLLSVVAIYALKVPADLDFVKSRSEVEVEPETEVKRCERKASLESLAEELAGVFRPLFIENLCVVAG